MPNISYELHVINGTSTIAKVALETGETKNYGVVSPKPGNPAFPFGKIYFKADEVAKIVKASAKK